MIVSCNFMDAMGESLPAWCFQQAGYFQGGTWAADAPRLMRQFTPAALFFAGFTLDVFGEAALIFRNPSSHALHRSYGCSPPHRLAADLSPRTSLITGRRGELLEKRFHLRARHTVLCPRPWSQNIIQHLRIRTMNTSNNCSATDLEVYHHVRLIELVLYNLIFFFGAVFNGLALWVFFCKIKKWTETKVYVINLVFADCFVICTLPSMSYLLWSKSNRNELCQFIEAIYIINMIVSTYIVSFISIDRYIAIKHPMKARTFRSPSKAALLCGLLWVSVIIGTTLSLWQRHAAFCFQKDSSTPTTLSLLSIFFAFTLPLAILTFCSTEVIRNLKRHLNTNSPEDKSIQKAIHIIYANLIVFLVCFLPASLGVLARFIMERVEATCFMLQVMKNFSSVTRCIATSNCCLDSICYYFVSKEFHEALPLPKSSPEQTNQTPPFQTYTC
ncbi:PREDICTED: G-protein coupled receptor 35-like isoform X3 [Calidris pugnax]|uniref:G-protein coupled receptor 35-like isoform X3 n=1 Tax=Calidris pugnax TaxID=198806 RepID=UPI00071D7CD7|nr:PREDICTED: G-protein coupled receptor 35-like isoform X3 [Calidris pugnax]